ncbi:MAG: hypothetical protein WC575_03280 [Patescibacteria group bacterium]
MKQFLTNIKKLLLPRRVFVPVILIITGFALFLVVWPSQAGFGASLAEWLIIPIAGFFGNMTVTLIGILISVAQYNKFIEATAVVKGWVMVRDVVNMFFIIMILLIAFGTVFRWENYHYKKMLGKLLIAAVLVNFSRGIVGFMIDFAQVIMLTFVYAFKDAAAGNFVQGFHLDKMFQFAQNTLSPEEARTLEADDSTFLVASLLALISIFITMVVVGVFLIVLIIRIVVLWFLVITSPIAFSLNIFTGDLKKYADQWWSYFGKYVTTGPILAFFLWLSLYVMQITGGNMKEEFTQVKDSSGSLADVPGAAITGIGSSEILLSFIVNIGLLVGALIMTQQAGVAGGKLAGAAVDYMRKAGGAIAKAPFKAISKAGKVVGKWGLERADDFQARMQQRFIKSELGQKIVKSGVGERFGLGKIAEHGIQFRTLPRAWKARNERKERQRLGEAAGVAEDIISSIRSLGKDKTNKSLEIRRGLVQQELKEISSVSTDKEYALHEYDESTEEYKNTDGTTTRRAIHGKEAKVEAIISMLATNHDTNELFKDGKFGTQYGMEYTSQNMIQLLKDLYGGGRENEQVARVAFNIQEIGLANSDGLLKGIAGLKEGKFILPDYFGEKVEERMKQKNIGHDEASSQITEERVDKLKIELQDRTTLADFDKTYKELEDAGETTKIAAINSKVNVEIGDYSKERIETMINSEAQAAVAASFIAKREGRNVVNKARFQDAFIEVADKSGNRTAGALSDVGKANIALNGKAMAAHWDFANEETKRYYAQNLDLIVKYREENIRNLTKVEQESFEYLISAVAKGVRIQNKKDLLSKDQIEAVINQSAPNRVGELNNIGKNRAVDGLPVAQGYTLPVYHPKVPEIYKKPTTDEEKATPTSPPAEPIQEEEKPKSKILDSTDRPYGDSDAPSYSYGPKESEIGSPPDVSPPGGAPPPPPAEPPPDAPPPSPPAPPAGPPPSVPPLSSPSRAGPTPRDHKAELALIDPDGSLRKEYWSSLGAKERRWIIMDAFNLTEDEANNVSERTSQLDALDRILEKNDEYRKQLNVFKIDLKNRRKRR